MLKLVIAAVAVAVIPTAVAAQTVTTDCYSKKNRVHCRSSVTPSLGQTIGRIIENSNRGDYRNSRAFRETIAEGERILAERAARGEGPNDPPNHSEAHQRFVVGDFIGKGDCPGAQAYAAATKNAATIARAAEFCGPAIASQGAGQ